MPKINVYLPDDLAAAVRDAGLSVSPVCQRALAEAVRVVADAREAVEVLRDARLDLQRRPEVTARVAGRMTPRLREALGRARELAPVSRHVGTAHLLIAVIDEPGNLGLHLLQSLDIEITALRDAAVRAGRHPEDDETPRRPRGKRPHVAEPLAGLSGRARLALAAGLEAATELGHDYLGCEHLVLGLAAEPGAAAGKLLRDAGADPETLRRAIPAAVAAATLGYRHARQLLSPTVDLVQITRRLDEFDARLRAAGL